MQICTYLSRNDTICPLRVHKNNNLPFKTFMEKNISLFTFIDNITFLAQLMHNNVLYSKQKRFFPELFCLAIFMNFYIYLCFI